MKNNSICLKFQTQQLFIMTGMTSLCLQSHFFEGIFEENKFA